MIPISAPSNLSEIDAFNQALVNAATNGGRIILEPGLYPCNVELPNGSKGFVLEGAGRERTYLRSMVKNKPVFQTNGLWYSRFCNLNFAANESNETSAVVDIDGPVDGHGHGIQGNTFDNCTFDGRGAATNQMSNYAFAMCRRAQGSGQGSENTFLNCHFIGAKQACALIIGFNALNNQFIGGNCQQYERCGLEMMFGSFHVFGMGFQSTTGLLQILNDGWDIKADGGGVGDSLSINACRTESLRFMRGNSAQPPMITNCNQRVALGYWNVGEAFAKDVGIQHEGQVYRCMVNHVATGTVTDALSNPQLWTKVNFDVVESLSGTLINNNWQIGNVTIYHDTSNPVAQVYSGQIPIYDMTRNDKVITVDASAGPCVINLFNPGAVPMGTEVEVIRGDQPINGFEHPVEIRTPYFNNLPVFAEQLSTIRRAVRYKAIGGGSFPRRWYTVGGFPRVNRF